MQNNIPKAGIIAARIIGLVTLGWAYAAVTDLRWLLHLHRVHELVPGSTFSFSYYPYLACNVGYLVAGVLIAGVLLIFPKWVLGVLTPAKRRGGVAGVFWSSWGIGLGLVLLVLGVHTLLSNVMWTVYQAGRDGGWVMEVCTSALMAAAGVYLCRRILGSGGVTSGEAAGAPIGESC